MPKTRTYAAAAAIVALVAVLVTAMYRGQTKATAPATDSRAVSVAEEIIKPTRSVAAEEPRSTAPKDITFDTIKLDMQKGDPYDPSLLTPAIKKLDGKSIRLRGYILPSFQQSGIKQFVLVRDNMECCFGPGAAIYDCVLVEMVDKETTDFTVRPVTVEGVFSLTELKDPDGKYMAIYHIDGRAVK